MSPTDPTPWWPVLRRLADTLDLFDLSFFLGGASCLLAVATFLGAGSDDGLLLVGVVDLVSAASSGLGGLAMLALLTAVLGFLAFTVGRSLRSLVLARVPGLRPPAWRAGGWSGQLQGRLSEHGLLEDAVVAGYVARAEAAPQVWAALYVALWAEVRDELQGKESWSLLRRLWVLTATYDSLAGSAVVWAAFLLVLASQAEGASLGFWVGGAVLALGVGLLCVREAARCRATQTDELVATRAAMARARQR